MKNRHRLWLIIIIIIAFILRFYNLSSVPPSASLDEASIGYNAYSILKTGGDEYGYKFPILLRAYDDWRPALYVYLVVPFVELFGLNVLAVRLPSVILSLLTILATYFLIIEIFVKKKGEAQFPASYIALLTTFLLAISPWHIYMSRLGHEVNAGLAFFIFGLFFFLKWLNHEHCFCRKENVALFFSLLSFSLSFVSYQSEKVFIPLLFISLVFIYKKQILQRKKQFLIASIIAGVILVPFIKSSLDPNALIRFKATNIVDTSRERFEKQALYYAKAVEENQFFNKVIYSRKILTLQIIIENYFSHFNPRWLFTNFSQDRHKIPNLGLLYLWELPLIILGIIYFIVKKINNNHKKLLFLWFLSAPIAGAITSDAPHAMRSFTLLPTFQIFSAVGFFIVLNSLKKKLFQKVFIGIFIVLAGISIVYLSKQYFFVFPKTQSASFQYAISQAIPFVLKHEKKYNKIIFSNEVNLYQSYMFFLFYNKYDPFLYQKQGGTKSGGFAQEHKIGKYEFRPINWIKEGSGLYIGNNNTFSSNAEIIASFSNFDGNPVIEITNK